MVKVKKDLTGHIYGRLTVLEQTEDYISPDGRHHCVWLCQCSCENKTILPVRGTQLRSGRTQSCGCLHIERIKESNKIKKKRYNKYDLSGEFGIGYTYKGEEFYFDLEDYDKIKEYSWSINSQGYVCGKRLDNSDLNVMIHRIIMDVENIPHYEVMVDHIHGKTTRNDNRKTNLRLANHSQNCINIRLKSNNTSGCTGVTWNKKTNKWHARITFEHNEIHLGFYDNKEDAIRVRKEAEKKYFGKWSYDYSQAI